MTSGNLDNLVKIGQLKSEPPSQSELSGLVRSASARLKDAHNKALSLESRFDLAYNASHALALAALRNKGYRSDNRYIVFQCLEYTLGIKKEACRVLAHCHNKRNLAEYEGFLDIDDKLLDNLIDAADLLLKKLKVLVLKNQPV